MAKKHSKRYNGGLKVADLAKDYPLKEAVEILSKLNSFTFFPELWDIRTTITNHALEQESKKTTY